MFYVVVSLGAIWVLWALSEWYTDRKFDIMVKRIEDLERRPLVIVRWEKQDDDNNEL